MKKKKIITNENSQRVDSLLLWFWDGVPVAKIEEPRPIFSHISAPQDQLQVRCLHAGFLYIHIISEIPIRFFYTHV